MKTNDPIVRKRMKWIGMILLAVVAALGFSYLYTRGVSPVWAAVAIVCFPGFFRFIYKIACIVMAALIYCDMGCGSCPSRTALFVGGRFKYEDKNEEKERENTSHWQADELQGKVGQCFLSDSKVGPQVVSEKIILAVLRYFPRKPCLTGSISLNALVVQRTAKVRVLTI